MDEERDGGKGINMIKTDCIINGNIFRKRKTLEDKNECPMSYQKARWQLFLPTYICIYRDG